MVETDFAITSTALAGAMAALVQILRPFLRETLRLPSNAIPVVVLVLAEVVAMGSVAAPEVDLYGGYFTAAIAALPLAMSAVGARELYAHYTRDAAPSART